MPHITKGGKFVFGWCKIQENGLIRLPDQAIQEYKLEPNSKVILISGSRTSGGFSVSNKEMLSNSDLNGIFNSLPKLANYSIEEGKPLKYKGRFYCWAILNEDNYLKLSKEAMDISGVKEGNLLLVIRSSNIAFVCIVKGPIIERAKTHPELLIFE
jgi:hypothetical protein